MGPFGLWLEGVGWSEKRPAHECVNTVEQCVGRLVFPPPPPPAPRAPPGSKILQASRLCEGRPGKVERASAC